jgi:transposase
MPNKYPLEVRERATRMALDRLTDYPSPWAACRDLGEKLNVGPETLRKWVRQAQVDAGSKPGASSAELEEIRRLKKENRELRETNAILKSAASFFARELDPRHHG